MRQNPDQSSTIAPERLRGCTSFYGRRFRIWQPDVAGENTSQALLDPYSFAHAFCAGLQFLLIPPVWLHSISQPAGYALNFVLHLLFEFIENTHCVIWLCRKTTPDKTYVGDTVLNSIGDLLVFSLTYLLTWRVWVLYGLAYAMAVPLFFAVVFGAFFAHYYCTLATETVGGGHHVSTREAGGERVSKSIERACASQVCA